MKINIQPVSIWKNGSTKSCAVVDINITSSDWNSYATFSYEVKETMNSEALAAGSVEMKGADFVAWDTAKFSKAFAKTFVATKLNLTAL